MIADTTFLIDLIEERNENRRGQALAFMAANRPGVSSLRPPGGREKSPAGVAQTMLRAARRSPAWGATRLPAAVFPAARA